MMKIEYWKIQNTGWTGGRSWFDMDYRLDTELEAKRVIKSKKAYFKDDAIKWRYVHVTIEWDHDKTVTTERFSDVS